MSLVHFSLGGFFGFVFFHLVKTNVGESRLLILNIKVRA